MIHQDLQFRLAAFEAYEFRHPRLSLDSLTDST